MTGATQKAGNDTVVRLKMKMIFLLVRLLARLNLIGSKGEKPQKGRR